MRWIITFLLCCSLQASINSETLTYEFFLPENFKSMLNLTGTLVSKNPETFPDLTTLYDDTYKNQLNDFQAMGIPNIELSESIKEIFKKLSKGGHRHFTLLCFVDNINERIHNIFSSDMLYIRERYPDILTKSKPEQMDIVYEWYKTQDTILFMEAYGKFIKDHLRFSDAPEDQFGRLIVNDEEVYRGTAHDE